MRIILLALLAAGALAAPAMASFTVAVPEPASLAVLAVGAGALVVARYWRK